MAKFGDTNTQDTMSGLPAGGTAGQALTKTTGADYDAGWAAVGGAGALGLRASAPGTIQNATTYVYAQIPALYLGLGRAYRIHLDYWVRNEASTASNLTAQLNLPGGPVTVWRGQIPAGLALFSFIPIVIDFLYVPTSTVTQALTLTYTSSSGNISTDAGGVLWVEDAGSGAYDNTLGLLGTSTATSDLGMTLGASYTVDSGLSVTVNIRAGEKYRITLANAYSKTSTFASYVVADIYDGVVNSNVWTRTFSSSSEDGYITGFWFYTATRTASVTFSVRYQAASAMSAGAWTLKGSATMPRQLAIERIAV